MALTNVTLKYQAGFAPGEPNYRDIVTLDLDASYPTGGYPEFNAAVAAVIGPDKTIQHIAANNIPGSPAVIPMYDRTNDKLVCYDFAGAEVTNATDLQAVVGLELVIFSN
jgi:hypothetical protein